jgi:hypothetical protein
MPATSLAYRWRRMFPFGAGAALMVGLVFAFAPESPAQAKKDEPAAEKEAERPDPKTGAKIVDVFDSKHGGVEHVIAINEHIEKGWKENKVQPSERCSDYEFIRRASLDIIGRIATPEEITRFLKDPENKRRSLLVNRLVDSPEFGENFADIWTVMLLTRSGSQRFHQDQMHEWLSGQFNNPPKNGWADTVTELISAEGATNENPAVNYLIHHVGEEFTGQTDPSRSLDKIRTDDGRFDMVPATSRTTKLFLGLRTQCVQCHDHPFGGEWQQAHFWGINAFLRQVDLPRGRPQAMMAKKKGVKEGQRELRDQPRYNVEGTVAYERRNATLNYTGAMYLDGKRTKLNELQASRRKELARLIITGLTPKLDEETPRTTYFAKVFVNRMWAHFMGKSFTKDAADDFGDHNPESHPELLLLLSKAWSEKYNHNPKDLVRWICSSRPYGLSSVANKGNDKPEDEVFFGRMLLKPMSPEQLFDSLMTATSSKIAQDKASRAAARTAWLNTLVVNFGNDEGEEGSYNGTVVQALMLMNGDDINKEIAADTSPVAAAMRKRGAQPKDVLKDLFMATLNRPPTAKEVGELLSPKMFVLPLSKGQPAGLSPSYFQDVFWALLNSSEFILNH